MNLYLFIYFFLHVKGPKYGENFQAETVWVKIRCQGYEGLDFLPLSLISMEEKQNSCWGRFVSFRHSVIHNFAGYFPRYNMKCSWEKTILREIFHVVSRLPLHFM